LTESATWKENSGMSRSPGSALERASLRSVAARGAFHLLSCAADRSDRSVLPIPAGGVGLVGCASSGARAARDAHDPRAVTCEPLARHGQELLLIACGARAQLELNGLPAPRVAALRPGDELRLGPAAPLLFVDFYREPPFVIAGPEHAGRQCQLCRGPIEAGRRVLACDCGALTHADPREEREPAPGPESLDCALRTCTGCSRELVTEAGYVRGGGADGRPS